MTQTQPINYSKPIGALKLALHNIRTFQESIENDVDTYKALDDCMNALQEIIYTTEEQP